MKRLSPTIAMLLLAGALNAFAADTAPAPAAADPLATARALIADTSGWPRSRELKRVDAKDNADWNNLMGYSHRKAKTPDYAAAERYYDAALAINPKHKGALEYSGELFLMIGDLNRAEQRLAALDKACFLPCSEYTDLKNAIAKFKANGNRVAAQN